MHREDYNLIAQTIFNLPDQCSKLGVMLAFADVLVQTHSNFDRELFIDACEEGFAKHE